MSEIIISVQSAEINASSDAIPLAPRCLQNRYLSTSIVNINPQRKMRSRSIRRLEKEKSKPKFAIASVSLIESTITNLIRKGSDFESVWNSLSESKLLYES